MQVIKGMHPSRDETKRKRYVVLLVRRTAIDDVYVVPNEPDKYRESDNNKNVSDISKVIKIEFPLTERCNARQV